MKTYRNAIILVALSFILSSCQSKEAMRMYDEVVLNPSDEGAMTMPSAAPADMMAGLPEGHPPIGASMTGQMPQMPGVTADMSLKFSWELPVDWVEREKSSMRLASFSSGSGETLVDCSIVALGGGAGGLEANIERWMRQINLNFSSNSELRDFIANAQKIKTGDGIEGTLIDFTTLQKNAKDSASSIVAVIFPVEGRNVFVKLAGPKSEILKNKSKFINFCQSLKVIQ